MLRKTIRFDDEKCSGCGGLLMAVKKAIELSGKELPCLVYIISPDGSIKESQ